jgi:hypothetical protein
MAEEKLRITITADNKDALAKFNQTIAGLDGISSASGKAGGATAKLGTNFTGLSRVIQDLPYGFNAISNNLTQLLPAAGAAGLAFSGIVAALTLAQIGFGAWTRGIGGASQATQEAAKANEEYIGGLAKEITQLQLLFRAATNANVPMEARLDAVKKMRDEYGEYLKNFTDEEIMAGKAGDAYRGLATAISMAAKARAASSMIEKAYLEKITLEQEIANKEKQKNIDLSNVKGAGVLIGQGGSGLGTGQGKVLSIEERKLIINNKFNDSVANTRVKIFELDQQINSLGETYEKSLMKPMKAMKELKDKPAADSPKIDGNFENYMNNMKALLPILDRFNASDAFQTLFLGKAKPIPLAPQRNTGTQDLQNLQLQVTANNTLNNALAIRNSEQMQYEEQLRESKAAALTNTLMNSVTGLFTAMQNGASLGEAFGNMFKQVAIDIAKAAVQAAIFQGILMAFGGGGGLSFGQGFLGGFKKLLGFSQGGTVSGPQSGYPVMLHGTEHIVRPDQMKQIIASASQMGGTGASKVIVEGRIQGQDIWLSQQRTNTFRGLTN